MKNAIVPDDMATPRYHQLEARIAATNESAAIRASNWWYLGVAMSSGTMAFFTCRLSE